MANCPNCQQPIDTTWKYCRFCGKPLEPHEETAVKVDEVKSAVKFDKDLYFKVLSTRSERERLNKKMDDLKNEISTLLEQLQSGLITREYAMPKVKELKASVEQVKKEEDNFDDIPEELPIEVLLREIKDAKERISKIDTLKNDPSVTKEAIREAKQRADESYQLLQSQYSLISGYLRAWLDELRQDVKTRRSKLEHLYIRFKTGELTEEAYNTKKEDLASELNKLTNVEEIVKKMIK